MENQNFKTTDFYSAVFLLAKGYKLIKIDKTNPRRFCFVFQDQENRAKLLEDFFNEYYFANYSYFKKIKS